MISFVYHMDLLSFNDKLSLDANLAAHQCCMRDRTLLAFLDLSHA